MLRTFVCALLFLSASTTAFAHWSWLNPRPQGHTLNDVEFLDDDTAIAIGEAGTVLTSVDGGLTWSATTKVLGITTAFTRIARIDATTAVVVGNAGVVLKTLDAGAHWFSLPSPSNLDLVDVDFVGASGVVGAGLDVFHTDDGGTTWAPLAPPGIGPIVACELLSTSTILAAGWVLARSTNGGQTWEGLLIGATNGNLSFADDNNGAFASLGFIHVTSDGGSNWTEQAIGPGPSETEMELTDLAFRDDNLIAFSAATTICDVIQYRCSSYGEAQFSTDGGLVWTIDPVGCEMNGVAANSSGVMLFVGEEGAIARRVPPAAIEVSNCSGWEASGAEVSFANSERGIVSSYLYEDYTNGMSEFLSGSLLRTDNAGDSWSSAYLGTLVTDVEFAPTGEALPPAYSIGETFGPRTPGPRTGFVWKSLDGGANSTPIWSSTVFVALRAIDFATMNRAVAVGLFGLILVIDNDVVTPLTIPGGQWFQDISFATASVAVTVGGSGAPPAEDGIMIRTENGGDSWSPVAIGVATWLYGVDFATDAVGVAVGKLGTILRTVDGGVSWEPVSSPLGNDLYGVDFWDSAHGFITGAGGAVLQTSNGGESWISIESPTTYALHDVEALGIGHAIFAGQGQVILRYREAPLPTLISSFVGEAEQFAVDLSWSVRDEASLSEFRIERQDAPGVGRSFVGIDAWARSFRDDTVLPGATYSYVLVAFDADGSETYSAPIRVATSAAELELLPNVPNPFNPSTTIRYVLPTRELVRVTIYDVAGRPVTTLVDREEAAGTYGVEWKGTDAVGTRVSSGVYLVRIEAGKRSLSRKIVLLK